MNKLKLVFALLIFTTLQIHAQYFYEDFEYSGGVIIGDWWIDPPVLDDVSGNLTGNIPGDGVTRALLDLGSRTQGLVSLDFDMYIPSASEASFNFQGEVPISTGEFIVGNIYFNRDGVNPNNGYIDYGSTNPLDWDTFVYPENQWFRVVMNFDLIGIGLDEATWSMYIDDFTVVPLDTPLRDVFGNIPSSLGGVEFFSYSSNTNYFMDNINYDFGIIYDYYIDYLSDDMESYTEQAPVLNNHWYAIGCETGVEDCTLISSSNQAYDGDLSGYIGGNGVTNAILRTPDSGWDDIVDFSIRIYIPENGEAFINFLENQPGNINDESMLFNLSFNEGDNSPGEGVISFNSTNPNDPIPFVFPHDEWFEIYVSDNDTDNKVHISINGSQQQNEFFLYTDDGEITNDYAALQLRSLSSLTSYYIDDIFGGITILGINDSNSTNLKLLPNPASNYIKVKSSDPILSIRVFTIQGQDVSITTDGNIIDVSKLSDGLYLLEAVTANGKSVQRFIKE